MKLIIAGSRDLDLTFDQLDDIIDNFDISDITEVVSGVAKGVDLAGEYWAVRRLNPIPVKRFPADWGALGKSAGPIRNQQMAEYADIALVIMKQGGSRGSMDMINKMKKLNKKVYVHEVDSV